MQCYAVNIIREARMTLVNTEWCGLLDLGSHIQAVLELKDWQKSSIHITI